MVADDRYSFTLWSSEIIDATDPTMRVVAPRHRRPLLVQNPHRALMIDDVPPRIWQLAALHRSPLLEFGPWRSRQPCRTVDEPHESSGPHEWAAWIFPPPARPHLVQSHRIPGLIAAGHRRPFTWARPWVQSYLNWDSPPSAAPEPPRLWMDEAGATPACVIRGRWRREPWMWEFLLGCAHGCGVGPPPQNVPLSTLSAFRTAPAIVGQRPAPSWSALRWRPEKPRLRRVTGDARILCVDNYDCSSSRLGYLRHVVDAVRNDVVDPAGSKPATTASSFPRTRRSLRALRVPQDYCRLRRADS